MVSFSSAKKDFDAFEVRREQIIRISRDLLKCSKGAIYAIHRNDHKKAKSLLTQARSIVKQLDALIKKDPSLFTVGARGEGLEEFVEASCYFEYATKGTIPSHKQLGVSVHIYLPGVCDLVGELTRKAMNDVIKGDYNSAAKIKSFVSQLYDELLLFDWRNTPVRRKFDSIKYSMEKLDELIVKVKLKGCRTVE